MSPGLVVVGIKVSLEGFTLETSVGSENFLGESSAGGLINGEFTSWLADTIVIAVFTFLGIAREDGSHEKIVRTSREVGWESSFITINGLSRLPGLVDTTEGNVLFIIRLGFRLHISGGFVKSSHSKSVVSWSFSGSETEEAAHCGALIVGKGTQSIQGGRDAKGFQ